MKKLVIIAAASENNVLGKDNDLVWRLPADFKRFKKLTSGHNIIMGRKTFESLPGPLPNRRHIVITRDKTYNIDHLNCVVVHTINQALEAVKEEELSYIVGGGEIYKRMLEMAHAIELTRVHTTIEGDTFFPIIEEKDWELVSEEHCEADEKHTYAFSYLTYKRRAL